MTVVALWLLFFRRISRALRRPRLYANTAEGLAVRVEKKKCPAHYLQSGFCHRIFYS